MSAETDPVSMLAKKELNFAEMSLSLPLFDMVGW
jgi:hypothetical protein